MAHLQLLDALKAHGLDLLYKQVFSKALSLKVAPGIVVDLMWAMGILLHLEEPLSIRELALLMDVPTQNLVRSFLGIQSILLIPEANNNPVHLVHTLLRDFPYLSRFHHDMLPEYDAKKQGPLLVYKGALAVCIYKLLPSSPMSS
ncbi:hypothetical protein SERLA73DRAFT_73168 [Serpula lacrymans var. lacrymans S7.3]|uniref:Uncharacterized protein n=2 Tax=Serpula lacrymans var. lacrymans TaxID=341189 RepID=F8PUP6_SERL3|nr:uncharacterized protein SERLADRAFT_437738 [Serpula lacrymans var. lacrymans S7.9]EGO00454.1 hypothetical protein SERLA73DRAFT_73168 [Serpula lacrymans var. lacrymans S7.3]EGO26008.1 hypothetical protein SERLADRAFT_437738 [Serpula lacrymans var. lacrymans S7.9]